MARQNRRAVGGAQYDTPIYRPFIGKESGRGPRGGFGPPTKTTSGCMYEHGLGGEGAPAVFDEKVGRLDRFQTAGANILGGSASGHNQRVRRGGEAGFPFTKTDGSVAGFLGRRPANPWKPAPCRGAFVRGGARKPPGKGPRGHSKCPEMITDRDGYRGAVVAPPPSDTFTPTPQNLPHCNILRCHIQIPDLPPTQTTTILQNCGHGFIFCRTTGTTSDCALQRRNNCCGITT